MKIKLMEKQNDLDLLREQLYQGAYIDIAEITGYSHQYVSEVMTARRNNSVIVEAARNLIKEHRKVLVRLSEVQPRIKQLS